jgi:hypothetical protein
VAALAALPPEAILRRAFIRVGKTLPTAGTLGEIYVNILLKISLKVVDKYI